MTLIAYIGKKDRKTDNVAGTGLTWAAGQEHEVALAAVAAAAARRLPVRRSQGRRRQGRRRQGRRRQGRGRAYSLTRPTISSSSMSPVGTKPWAR